MLFLPDSEEGLDRCVIRVSTPGGLSAIRRPGCAAVVWKRSPSPWMQTWIDSLSPEHLPRSQAILRPELVCDALLKIIESCGAPQGAGRDLLVEDVSALAVIFADIMRADYLRVRLDVSSSTPCREFHIDAVTARLVCTYRGTGTQYGISTDGGDPSNIRTVPTGSPVILRGAHWPETPISGLLHRSPLTEGAGETRLILVLDPVDDPANERNRHFMH